MPSPARFASRLRTPGLETLDDLRARLDYAYEHASSIGRVVDLEIVFMPLGLDMFHNAALDVDATVDSMAALARAGVTYATVTLPGGNRAELIQNIHSLGDTILPAVAAL
jgi:chorismate synthase